MVSRKLSRALLGWLLLLGTLYSGKSLITVSVYAQANQTKYVVIFDKSAEVENVKSQVLALPSVRFVEDTTFGVEELPAIIITTSEEEVEKIRKLPGVSQVELVSEVDIRMPAPAGLPKLQLLLGTGLLALALGGAAVLWLRSQR